MNKIFMVFGTRPEAIKMASVIKQIEKNPELKSVVCVTAQHRQMLDQVLKVFNIRPDYDVDIMRPNQDLFDVTANVLVGLREILSQESPDIVLVQGDTTTAFAAGLASYYLRIPIGHIEAGLRTHNKYSPFPEEKNRHLLSTLADYHFAPTERSKANLLREGIAESSIWITGNTVVDALLLVSEMLNTEEKRNYYKRYFKEKYGLSLGLNQKKMILVTGHRRENFGAGIEHICMSLQELAEDKPDVTFVYPVHLNPNIQRPVKSILNGKRNIYLIDPLEYEPFVFLMKESYLILTDSGGIQEEAPSLGKPVLVMRDTTERPEAIDSGTAKIIGTGRAKIVGEVLRLLDDKVYYETMSKSVNPFGDGKAAEYIVQTILCTKNKSVNPFINARERS